MEYSEEAKKIYNEVCDKNNHHWLDTYINKTMAMEMINSALSTTKDKQLFCSMPGKGFCPHETDGGKCTITFKCENHTTKN